MFPQYCQKNLIGVKMPAVPGANDLTVMLLPEIRVRLPSSQRTLAMNPFRIGQIPNNPVGKNGILSAFISPVRPVEFQFAAGRQYIIEPFRFPGMTVTVIDPELAEQNRPLVPMAGLTHVRQYFSDRLAVEAGPFEKLGLQRIP